MTMKIGGLAREAKRALIRLNGRVTRSQFYLSNLISGERLTLSMTPEKVSAKTTTNFRSYNIIERGEVKIPRGERLTRISWHGLLPGANILMLNVVNATAWQPPLEVVKMITRWREQGDKINLLITQTPINLTTFIQAFDYELAGGQGSIAYSIELVAAKDLQVKTVEEKDSEPQEELNERAAMNRTGEQVAAVENAWQLAQVLTGNGGDWEKISEQQGISDPENLNEPVIWN